MDNKEQNINKQNPDYVYSLNWWRLIFTILICLLHYEGVYYQGENPVFETSYLAVEFFFILSGFLLMQSCQKVLESKNISSSCYRKAFHYTAKRVRYFYPWLVVAWIANILVNLYFNNSLNIGGIFNIINEYFEDFFLLGSLGNNILIFPIWYISSLLIVGYFTYFLIVFCEDLYFGLLSPLACLVIYIFYRFSDYGLDYHITYQLGFTGALLRGMLGVTLGCITYKICLYIKQRLTLIDSLRIFALSTFLEVGCLVFLYTTMINQIHGASNLRVLILFPVLIGLSFINTGAISRWLNQYMKWNNGNLCLFIYLNHLTAIPFVIKYLYQFGFWLSSIFVIAILVSIYYLYLFFYRNTRD